MDVGEPGPGQVRLRQTAVGLNYIDVYHRTGLYPQPLPFTPGDGGGGRRRGGRGRRHGPESGDRVAYAGPIGGYAEARLIDADRLVKLPDDISVELAAAMMLQGMTARMLLRARLRGEARRNDPRSRCRGRRRPDPLPMGEGARRNGDRDGVDRRESASWRSAHGCHHPIVYTRQDFVAEVDRITDGAKLPVVYDSVGRDTFLKSLDCLRPRGLMVSYGNASGPPDPIAPALLAQKGSLFLTRPTLFHYIATRDELEQSARELFDMVRSGKVKIEIGQRFALKDAAEAHRRSKRARRPDRLS